MHYTLITFYKNKIKDFFSIRNSTIKKNFLALSVLQISNYIFPLITIPYVTRVLGTEIFGLLNFATSVLAYFSLIVSYGFDLSASREIARNRDNQVKLNEIFNNVLFSKLLLFIISSLVFVIVLLSIEKISHYKTLYLIMYFGVLFNIFFPTWFFQGLEKLNFTALFTFIVRFFFTILIFFLIKTKEDYLFYPISTIFGQFFVSIVSIVLVTNKFGIIIKIPKFSSIINTLKESWKIFAITVVINLYTTTNFVLLGFLTNNYEVGLFSAAHKVIVIILSIVSVPLGQSLYPNIAYAFKISIEEGIKKINKSLVFVVIITLVPSILFLFFPSIFIIILFGEEFSAAINTLQILSFIPIIIGLSNIFGIQALLNLKKDNIVYLITLIGSIIGISLNLLLVPQLKHNGTAISWLITETIITLLLYASFIKEKNHLLSKR